MKNILVCVDFNDSENVLINEAYKYAKAFGAKLRLMHVVAPNPEFIGYELGLQEVRDSRAEELKKEHRQIQAYAKGLNDRGVEAEALLIQGETIELITSEAKKLGVELIIAGHHKYGFLYNALIGTVSSQIIKKSKIPVLTVPLN